MRDNNLKKNNLFQRLQYYIQYSCQLYNGSLSLGDNPNIQNTNRKNSKMCKKLTGSHWGASQRKSDFFFTLKVTENLNNRSQEEAIWRSIKALIESFWLRGIFLSSFHHHHHHSNKNSKKRHFTSTHLLLMYICF